MKVSKSDMVSAPAQAQGAVAPLVDPLMAEHFLRSCDPPASVSGVSELLPCTSRLGTSITQKLKTPITRLLRIR